MRRRWTFAAATALCLPLTVLALAGPASGEAATPDPQGLGGCPAGRQVMLYRDDDTPEVQDEIYNDEVKSFYFNPDSFWQQSQYNGVPQKPWTGANSWFAWDAAPGQNGSTQLVSTDITVPTDGATTYLYFAQSYDFAASPPGVDPDGGRVIVQSTPDQDVTWVTESLPWANGPTATTKSGVRLFAGNSHAVSTSTNDYVSSRLDLSRLAGKTVHVVFEVRGGHGDHATKGWWVDDIRMYSCYPHASAPATTVAAGRTAATVSWSPPQTVDQGSTGSDGNTVQKYEVTGAGTTAYSTARSLRLSGLRPNTGLTVHVAAVTTDGVGAASAVRINATHAAVTTSVAKARRNRSFLVRGTVTRRGAYARVSGMRVLLQRHGRGQRTWRTVSAKTTNTRGIASWSTRQSATTYYRVVASGVRTWLGTTSTARAVAMRR